ncbi:MAG: hypothetical protein EZS28_003461 [Streblomastix strix]|uniref:Uncharacterized protein n=1 Tax=Streblomastix strix TaxID=222440 RepID=A0A5J4X1F9_9EUKA|nr:MAG: hypothetical protein EZS28_003461 [Streblomastix strix]
MLTRLVAKKASKNTKLSEKKMYQTRLNQKKASEAEDNVATDDQETSEAKIGEITSLLLQIILETKCAPKLVLIEMQTI